MTTLIAALAIATASPMAQPSALQRQDQNREPERPRQEWVSEWGTQWIDLEADGGAVTVYLPEDIVAGDTISGSMFAKSETTSGRQVEGRSLNGLTLEIGDVTKKVGDNMFTVKLPTDDEAIDIVLRDGDDRIISRTTVQFAREGRSFEGFSAAKYCQAGTGLEVVGPFDGDRNNTVTKINDKTVGVLTESPRACVVSGFINKVGPQRLMLKERNETFAQQVNALVLTVLPPENAIRKGGKAYVELHIDGLENMSDDAFPVNVVLSIDNLKAVRFVDTNDDEITLRVTPGEVRGSEWQKAVQIQAKGTGTYGLNARIY